MENKRNLLESEVDLKDLIVIDNGTDSIKMGYSGENHPRIIIDSITGRINRVDDGDQISKDPVYIFGNQLKQSLKEKKLDITLNQPIQRGKIVDRQQMKSYWEYLMEDSLQIGEIQNCDIMMIDSLYLTKDYRHDMAEILFEEMKIQSVSFMNSSCTALFSAGETTGLVLESGHGMTTVCPIFEGYPQYHSFQQVELAGQDVTDYIHQQMIGMNCSYNFDNSSLATMQIIKDIKHTLCVVPENHDRSINHFDRLNMENKCFELPDGQIITIDPKVKYTSGEICFNPQIIGKDYKSVQQMILDAFLSSDEELQSDVINAIVLSGGNTLIQGYTERVKYEFENLLPQQARNAKFRFDSQRQYSSWVGGSMLGSISTFQQLAITRSEYDENPESKQFIVQKRTF